MAKSIADKLKIKANDCLLTLQAPANFVKELQKLPAGVTITTSAKNPDQIHWFVSSKKQVENEKAKIFKVLQPTTIVWVYFPKGSSGLQTDLSRDKGWDALEAEKDKITWINLISFNETWSVFGFRLSTANEKTKASTAPVREIFNWVNPTTKEVRLPDELKMAFKKNKKVADYFHSLAFSHKKEYIEWIVTAKKEETKLKRIEGTMERLENKWKNPTTP